MSDDWLDIGDDSKLPVTIDHLAEEVGAFPAAWSRLTDAQRKFLEAWRACGFSRPDAIRLLGKAQRSYDSTEYRWRANEDYAFAKKMLQKIGAQDALQKHHQVVALERIAQKLEDPKPILYMGAPTGYEEFDGAAAARVRETLLKVGGHLKEETQANTFLLPQLIVQTTERVSGNVIDVKIVGETPTAPVPESIDWMDA